MNIAWWVQRWADLHPQKCAIIFKDEKITYFELNERANRASCWLQSLGIEKGDRVAAMLSNRPEFIELFLACARLGAIFVPLNFRLAAAELEYLLKNCRPGLFVFDYRLHLNIGHLRSSKAFFNPLAGPDRSRRAPGHHVYVGHDRPTERCRAQSPQDIF
jgi:fatty-acyl-CoA synthase